MPSQQPVGAEFPSKVLRRRLRSEPPAVFVLLAVVLVGFLGPLMVWLASAPAEPLGRWPAATIVVAAGAVVASRFPYATRAVDGSDVVFTLIEVFYGALMLLAPPVAAGAIAGLATLSGVVITLDRAPLIRSIFTAANDGLAVSVGGACIQLGRRWGSLADPAHLHIRWYLAYLLGAAVYEIVDGGLLVLVVRLSTRRSLPDVARSIVQPDIWSAPAATLLLGPVLAVLATLNLALTCLTLIVLIGLGRVLRTSSHHKTEATTDPLTKLANRRVLEQRLEQITRNQPNTTGALLLVDLDQFKHVNDTFGHHAGDAVLVEAADRLTSVCGPHDLVARLGGDEFAILTSNWKADDLERLGRNIAATLGQPVLLDDGIEVTVGASVGVALRSDGGNAADFLRRADAAMYRAKSGPGVVTVHSAHDSKPLLPSRARQGRRAG